MKVRITDLMDSYADLRIRPASDTEHSEANIETNNNPEEMIPLKAEVKRFGWKQGLAIAASLVLFVGAGFGVHRLLQHKNAEKPLLANLATQYDTNDPAETRQNPETPPAPAEILIDLPADPDVFPTDPGDMEAVAVQPELQLQLNSQLSLFAEQGIHAFDARYAEEYTLVSFAHLYYKLHPETGALDYTSLEGESYETISLEHVNELLSQLTGRTLAPEDGTDYTQQQGNNYAVHETYRDGTFFFPAADGDPHNYFAVVTQLWRPADSTTSQVYQKADFAVYSYDQDQLTEERRIGLYDLTPDQAADLDAAGTITLCGYGAALVSTGDDHMVVRYYANDVFTYDEMESDVEEEYPQEYPIQNYRLDPDAITQTGIFSGYEYEQLPGADIMIPTLNTLASQALDGEPVSFYPDTETMRVGYANWHYQGDQVGASVSGSSITGRFSYSLHYTQALGLRKSFILPLDSRTLQEAASTFAASFGQITGDLQVVAVEEDVQHFSCSAQYWREVALPCQTYTFVSERYSSQFAELQPGTPVPVSCGYQISEGDYRQCFRVTVLYDGTVIRADNAITSAQLRETDTVYRMLDESDMNHLLSFFTSFTEDDTLIIHAVDASEYSVYFGSAVAEPCVRISYSYASNPDEILSTLIVLSVFDSDIWN